MIIVEGMDNTGKSSLIESLIEKFPQLKKGFRIKFDGDGPSKEYIDRVIDLLSQSSSETHDTIFDRILIFSDNVYGPIIRGKTAMDPVAQRLMFSILINRHEPLIIYCKRTPEQIRATFKERNQLPGVEDHVEKLCASYDTLMEPFHDYQWFVEYDFDNEVSRKAVDNLVTEYLG